MSPAALPGYHARDRERLAQRTIARATSIVSKSTISQSNAKEEEPLSALWNWPFLPANAVSVAGWGFWLSVTALLLTLGGFLITWVQINKTTTAAEAARAEAERVHTAFARYDAAQEIARAATSLKTVKQYFNSGSWSAGAEFYESVRNSLLAVKSNSTNLDAKAVSLIEEVSEYVDKLCERVDKGEFSTPALNVIVKTKAVVRSHERYIADIAAIIKKDSV